ncbi:Acg family FMN-binding oxidoreductase [Mycolicibacterium smegmatis]|jgi:hypothetical protein|uniref:NAD(P)H nitroreductase acg n=3 Tax=Mycolicibacterium smegmatis TaxID=1772 RepID=I7FFW1_MYCS2|nr:NAD(P)H nitroreductase [Mycolicibacterium smegmatis]AFP40310.1 Putative uncharacterized protein acg [Mycolicibacterium smegmatis MC2 155]AIU09057.1 NAD(P)H nitroreductase [Mycolicibacterium smegmatis MC2 155]AIU15682.1 NAD(P)H nitroreductase [Mycolicibacterium smegmatis]AIU22305.1 NAD(P)H nitroreductase [Mycolicibacterium smegmatis]AWT54896.1 hypothetical protein D806_039300 [Mycolicibacterium smegmatis MKD8]
MRDAQPSVDVIGDALRLACRAPSLHNSQPWLWAAVDKTLHLFVDKQRILYSADHMGREAVIGCGAMLDHFCVAMAADGWVPKVARLTDRGDPLHLASIEFPEIRLFPREHRRRRAAAISRRRTDRLPFAEPADWPTLEVQLRKSIAFDTVGFDVVPDHARPELAYASRLTESLRQYDSSYHAELYWWTGQFESIDGIPYSALVSASESERVGVGRRFPNPRTGDRCAGPGHDQAKVVVLSTLENDRTSILNCGEALSAVLLDATVAGMATCTLTHITELATSRDIVARLIGQEATPQVLIRVGVATRDDDAPATPRRPLEEFFTGRSPW